MPERLLDRGPDDEDDAASVAARSPFRLRNVRLILYLQFALLVIWSFSMGANFDAYLLELARSRGRSQPNAFVGSVETVRGMTSLVLAWPLGVLADKVSRRRVMRYCGGLGILGIALLVTAILSDAEWLIYTGVVLSAVFMQIYLTCSGALLADSVPRERLTEVIAWQSSLMLLGTATGPAAQMVIIACVGDSWDLPKLHVILCAGFAIWPLTVPAFFLLEKTPTERQAELGAAPASAAAAADAGGSLAAGCPAAERWNEHRVLGVKKKWLVPSWIELCSLVTAMGAGMTVKFFPLFFKEDYHFDPMALCGLNAIYPVVIAIFVQLCRKFSTKVGRTQAALTWHILGTICIFGLWKATPLPLVVACFLVRGGFMNAMAPINTSIIMDCVDSKYRGRWSALQSISRFSWSGSAIFGGWLADSHDYRYTFYITGLMYASSAVIYLPLLCLVPAREPSRSSPTAAPAAAGGGRRGEGCGDARELPAAAVPLQIVGPKNRADDAEPSGALGA